jgi:small subunit ribosomal protein SAe
MDHKTNISPPHHITFLHWFYDFLKQDITKLLMASAHIGTKNTDNNMKKYVYTRRDDGTNIIDLHKTWEKMLLAARVITAIENPKDVCPISGRPFGTRAVLKFAGHIGARAIAG